MCLASAGVGTDFEVLIRGYWLRMLAVSGDPVGFSRPIVDSVNPTKVAMAGGQIVVSGSSFGGSTCGGTVHITMTPPDLNGSSPVFNSTGESVCTY